MLEEMIPYAKRIAFKMSQDPEMASIAYRAAWYASKKFDPSRGVPPRRFLAMVVKQYVWNYWRQIRARREKQKSENWWREVVEVKPLPTEGLPQRYLQLLVEKYELKWPWDVMAKKHGVTKSWARKMVAEAEAALLRITE